MRKNITEIGEVAGVWVLVNYVFQSSRERSSRWDIRWQGRGLPAVPDAERTGFPSSVMWAQDLDDNMVWHSLDLSGPWITAPPWCDQKAKSWGWVFHDFLWPSVTFCDPDWLLQALHQCPLSCNFVRGHHVSWEATHASSRWRGEMNPVLKVWSLDQLPQHHLGT